MQLLPDSAHVRKLDCGYAHATHLAALSVLDRDIFNQEFEHQWRAHLEVLSDEDLRVMEPQYAFCGLYDRLERINKAYDEELERRGLAE